MVGNGDGVQEHKATIVKVFELEDRAKRDHFASLAVDAAAELLSGTENAGEHQHY
jgi:hypothetical protein